eukprot:3359519-Lingulodinium_polyedra.AAC.1
MHNNLKPRPCTLCNAMGPSNPSGRFGREAMRPAGPRIGTLSVPVNQRMLTHSLMLPQWLLRR